MSTSDNELEVVFDNMHEGMVIQDQNDKILKFNLQACEILGLTPNQLQGKDSMDPQWQAIKEDGSPYLPEEHPSVVCMKSGNPQYNKIMGVRRSNGELRWIQINSSPIFGENKKIPEKTVTTFNDISQIMKLKQSLELNKFRMEVAMEALQFGIWDWDITNNVLVWDEYMYQIFGANKNDFNGAYEAFEACLDPADKDRVRQNIEQSIVLGNQIFESEFHIFKPNNLQRRLIKAVSKILRHDGNIRMIGVNYDITEQRQAEAMLHQTAKIYSLGEMAAGVAHEINNPLAIISGRVTQIEQMIRNDRIDANKLKEYCESIKNTSHRMASIVKGLLNFSRDGSNDKKESVKIVSLIKEALSFCEGRLSHKDIKFILDEKKEYEVLAKNNDISQIIINLFNNAIDALATSVEKWIKVTIEEDAQNVFIYVYDSGKGIDKEIVNQIFDPFFSTKEFGKGTGLGLSISKGIAERNDGDLILVEGAKNTCFRLSLKKA